MEYSPFRLTPVRLAAALAVGLAATAAQASLVLGGPEDFQGTGLGSVNTLLTITSPANTSFEQGSVGLSATNTVVTSGDTTALNQVQTLGTLGVTSAADLRVVFNALEPGNGDNAITLTNLVLNIYSSSGSLLFTSGAFTPVTFNDTQTGAGNSGFVFHLDAAQAAAAQAAAFGAGFETNQVGITAAAGCQGTPGATCMGATGGFETFFVANTTVVPSVPEPSTYALLLAGFGAIGFAVSRKKRSN